MQRTINVATSSRRGDIFLLGLNMLFLIGIILVFWKLSAAFEPKNPDEGIGTRPSAMLQTYAVAEKMLLYIDNTAPFAIYESIYTLSEKGGSDKNDLGCGQYAGYTAWSRPGKNCFPNDVGGAFSRELRNNLRSLLSYPGMPSGINYAFTFTWNNGIGVRATTDDRITLPILTNSAGPQLSTESLIREKNFAQLQTSVFVPDTKLSDVQVVPSPNFEDRKTNIKYVVITISGTKNYADTINDYQNDEFSTHYLIDTNGKIVQVVPEDKHAYFTDPCEQDGKQLCKIPDIEDQSIGVVLVNAGYTDLQNDGTCPDGYDVYDNGASGGAKECWWQYTDEQLTSLSTLTAEIASRRGITTENVLFEDDSKIRSDLTIEGPSLHTKSITTQDWLANFKKDVESKKANSAVQQATKTSQTTPVMNGATSSSVQESISIASSQDLSFALPVQKPIITSCWGVRQLNDHTFHNGIDLVPSSGGAQGSSITAIADGVVLQTCENGVRYVAPDCNKQQAIPCAEPGNNILLSHPPSSLSSRYSHLSALSVKCGDTVSRGQQIGTMGNSGSTSGDTGVHLDLKIYRSDADKTGNGVNPLCFFSDATLSEIKDIQGTVCAKYNSRTISRDNPMLAQECVGITPQKSGGGCGLAMQQSSSGSKEVDAAKQTMEQYAPGVQAQIAASGSKEGVDPRLLIAIITTESHGNPNLVSASGCLGISQFCYGTATGYSSIFKKLAGDCSKVSCTKENDDRYDAFLSVQAQAQLIKNELTHFQGKTDQVRFAIAAYNAGDGVIDPAIKKTGLDNPSWEDVSKALDEQIIYGAYCKNGCATGYFSDPAKRAGKVTEIRNYVQRVSGFYTAQGGSLASAGFDCAPADNTVNVKELGSYAFLPNFNAQVPASLQISTAKEFAEKTYTACTGDGVATATCFAAKAKEFNDAKKGLTLKPAAQCEDVGRAANIMFTTFMDECKNNKQTDCTCEWTPPWGAVTVRLFDDYGVASGNGVVTGTLGTDPRAIVRIKNQSDPTNTKTVDALAQVDLVQLSENNTRSITVLPRADWTNKDAPGPFKVSTFRALKQNGKLIWLTSDDMTGVQYPTCGAYHTTEMVCMESDFSVPRLTKGTYEKPRIKFALYLNDVTPPKQVEQSTASATVDFVDMKLLRSSFKVPEGIDDKAALELIKKTETTPGFSLSSYLTNFFSLFAIKVNFARSSDDVSYYLVSCKVITSSSSTNTTTSPLLAQQPRMAKIVVTQENAQAQTYDTTLLTCDGKSIDDKGSYEITITPYDVAGNAGTRTIVQSTVSDGVKLYEQIPLT